MEDATESAKLQDVPHLRALALRVRLPIHLARGEWSEAAAAADEINALLPRLTKTFAKRTLSALVAGVHAERDPERFLRELGPLENAEARVASPYGHKRSTPTHRMRCVIPPQAGRTLMP